MKSSIHTKIARAYLLQDREPVRGHRPPPSPDPWESKLKSLSQEHDAKWRDWATALTHHRTPPSATRPHGINIERGSSSIPLIAEGRHQIESLAQQFIHRTKLHPISAILTPDLPRCEETAQILSRLTKAPITDTSPDWQTQRMGWMEGMPSDEIQSEKTRLRRHSPNEAPLGQGPFSTLPGESTNHFLHRRLAKISKVMKTFDKKPDQIIILVNHYSGIKADQAWLKNGQPADHSVDMAEFLRHDGKPGAVHRLYQCEAGDWHMKNDFDMSGDGQLPPGIYEVRHGLTAWNAEAKVEPPVKESKVDGDGRDSQILQHLTDAMRSPGYSRLPSAVRDKLKSAKALLNAH